MSRTHFLRNVIIISYPVYHKLFEVYHHISQVDYLCILGLFVPNWPMSLTVLLGKAIFFSVLHNHRQDCVRSVDISMSMTSFKSGVDCIMWLVSKVRLTVTFKSAVSLTKLHFKFQKSKHKPNVSFCLSMPYIYVTINCNMYISRYIWEISLLLFLLLAWLSFMNLFLFQNCPPLFSVLLLTSPVLHTHLL